MVVMVTGLEEFMVTKRMMKKQVKTKEEEEEEVGERIGMIVKCVWSAA